jgi:pimeloyl-ACP methyl ester carboxylesterase
VLLTARRIAAIVLAAALAAGGASRSPAAAQGTRAKAAPRPPRETLATASDHWQSSGRTLLRFRDIGQGEPVVLLHGATRDLESWAGLADSLAIDHRVVAVDQRGHGRSSKHTNRADFGVGMVEDIVLMLDMLHVQRAHLVGHSLGAVVAANIAARHPDRVASVSLVAPPLYADSATYMHVYEAGIADLEHGAGMARLNRIVFPRMPDSVARAASDKILATIPAPTLAALFASLSTLMLPRSAATDVRGVPALVAVGTDDPLATNARALASWWPGARLIEVRGADHASVIDRPAVRTAIRRHIRTHALRASAHGARRG